ncbi:MAG TPA: hypothetical protein VMH00_09650 [Candidatus Limnocylindrales bacterium]|nr:hypothetical protein [Candidatus Limnocylindrales bacterium]
MNEMKDCGKYSEWLKDAALGELNARSDRELLAHAAQCDACRDAYQHAREVGAFVDRAVESLVEGEPSAQFATRLRARIAEEGTRRRLGWWAWALIATTATAAVVALLTLSRTPLRPVPGPQFTTNVPAQPTARTPLPITPPAPGGAQTHPVAVHTPTTARHRVPDRAALAAQPEVIVQPGQLDAIAQFADAIHAGRIDADQLVASEDRVAKPLEINPIEIKPLEQPPATEGSSDTTADSGRP